MRFTEGKQQQTALSEQKTKTCTHTLTHLPCIYAKAKWQININKKIQ